MSLADGRCIMNPTTAPERVAEASATTRHLERPTATAETPGRRDAVGDDVLPGSSISAAARLGAMRPPHVRRRLQPGVSHFTPG
eukprot:scaffold11620_cov119-Isochrysis_galbana.AAC.2